MYLMTSLEMIFFPIAFMFSPTFLLLGGGTLPANLRYIGINMNAKESIVFMFKGGFKLGTYWQFHFGKGGGSQIGHPIGSFILGREGGFKLGTILAVSFWEGGRRVPLQVDW